MRNSASPTLKNIAKKLNVSVTTVSKVINNHPDISKKTRQEVLAAIKSMHYVPNFMASNLRKQHGNIVGLVVSDITKPFFEKVMRGYEAVLMAAGYQTLFFNSDEDAEKEYAFVRQLRSLNVAGIVLDMAQNSRYSVDFLREAGIPFVLSSRYVAEERDYYVVMDDAKAGYLATCHLLDKKPGRPVYCLNGPDGISPTIGRFAGYRKALLERCVGYEPGQVFYNHFGLKEAYETARRIASTQEAPFSLFCSTDQIAMGAMRAVYDCGLRVPEDVGIIGVDDIDYASYTIPALSTVALPKEGLGEASANMLISLIEKKPVEQPRILLEPSLVVRSST